MVQVTKKQRAEEDLDEIWFYIAKDNLAAADKLLDEIGDSCRLLAQDPFIGRSRPELAPDLRSFPVSRYIVFYAPSAFGVEIVRVLHSARDINPIHFSSEGNA